MAMIMTGFFKTQGLRLAALVIGVGIVVVGWGPRAEAAELVMVESSACEWCETWHEEIGVIYSKTDEAQTLPLRRIDIYDERPHDLKDLRGIMYTPTFIIVEEGKELARILGYPGEDFFWQFLNGHIKNLNLEQAQSSYQGS